MNKDVLFTCNTVDPYTKSTRKCAYCTGGQYQDQEAQTSCKGDLCSPGTFAPPVPYVNPVTCSTCPGGQYTSTHGQVKCIGDPCEQGKYAATGQIVPHNCTACEVGKYQHQSGQSTCLDCPISMYQDEIGATQCKAPPTMCAPGTSTPARTAQSNADRTAPQARQSRRTRQARTHRGRRRQ